MSKALRRATQILQASSIINGHQLGILANQCPKFGILSTRNYCNIPSSIFSSKASQLSQSCSSIPTSGQRYSSTHASMSNTITPADPAILEIVNFWFEEIPREAWFNPVASKEIDLDNTIDKRFSSYVEKAVNSDGLDHWTSTSMGTLALILCLDQFTRNIYRPGRHSEAGKSWSGDAKALQTASEAIANGQDRDVEAQIKGTKGSQAGRDHRFFFYLPFMHAEDLVAQIANVALFETMEREILLEKSQLIRDGKDTSTIDKEIEQFSQAIPFSKKHRDCVATLGRFPKRNEPLGRTHTEEEKKWLEKFPQGF